MKPQPQRVCLAACTPHFLVLCLLGRGAANLAGAMGTRLYASREIARIGLLNHNPGTSNVPGFFAVALLPLASAFGSQPADIVGWRSFSPLLVGIALPMPRLPWIHSLHFPAPVLINPSCCVIDSTLLVGESFELLLLCRLRLLLVVFWKRG